MSEHDKIGKCGFPPSKVKKEIIIEGTIKKRKTRTSKRSLFSICSEIRDIQDYPPPEGIKWFNFRTAVSGNIMRPPAGFVQLSYVEG